MNLLESYQPRRPLESILYKVINDHIEEFLCLFDARDDGKDLPAYVKREFESYLRCGCPEYGLTRVSCHSEECKTSVWVPTACKKRGFCPSCGARRMYVAAINLSEKVLPWVPIRQWVISVPFPLRLWMAGDCKLTSLVNKTIVRVISSFLRKKARRQNIKNGVAGCVTFIQRWGGALNSNTHFHILFLDGVYKVYKNDSKPPIFIKASPISEEEIVIVVEAICRKVTKLLFNTGHLKECHVQKSEILFEASPLSVCRQASVMSRIAFGPRAGKKVRTIGKTEFYNSSSAGKLTGHGSAIYGGFSLHAGTRLLANERDKVEALIRYVARSSVALERLSETADGNIRYEFKSPWRDGTKAAIFSKMEFIEKIAALVPYPHKNLVIYSGCLAAHHAIRSQIIPAPAGKQAGSTKDGSKVEAKRYIPWAELLKRTWGIDVFVCKGCGGPCRIVAFITDRVSLLRIIASAGLLARPPPRSKDSSLHWRYETWEG